MSHRRVLRLLGCAVLALALAPSFATPAYGAVGAGRPARLAASVSAWSGAAGWLSGVWKSIGCLVLPIGICTPSGGTQPTSEYGCGIDPNGLPRCDTSGLTQSGSDRGRSVDFNGMLRCGELGPVQPQAD